MKFQVFTQPAAGAPHTHCGSVYAPDAEMALLLGRDVYTRRPQTVSLWVAPAEAVFARTAEQLQAGAPPPAPPAGAPQHAFHVFCKVKPAGALTWQAEIRAPSPEHALAAARQELRFEHPPALWWVVPAAAVTPSAPQDARALFTPAENKPFRHSSYYRVVSRMRRLRREKDR